MKASQLIAEFAVGFSSYPISDHQRHIAYRALLDTYACAIAGRHEHAVRIAARYTAEQAGSGRAQAWGSGVRLPAEAAALVNGIAAHVLDYDDVMTPMRAHVSATLVPALAALGPMAHADGRQYARAYIAGFEVMAKFARTMALPHYSKGWHSTSALGILGTTTACAVLLGLSTDQIVHALGLAVAQASGSRQNFGTMAKSFQSAHGAACAVRAALLAQHGMKASEDAIDGKYGFMALYAANEDMAPSLATLAQGGLEIDSIGIDVKKYPCCYALHRALDAVLDLRKGDGALAARVAAVRVLTSAGGLQALISDRPDNGLQAKFSMEYALACALTDGAICLSSFSDDAVYRSDIQALMTRVQVIEAGGDILPRWSQVSMELNDGIVLERKVSIAHGDASDPLTDEELILKAEDCFAYGGYDIDARSFAKRIFDMADRPLETLLDPTD